MEAPLLVVGAGPAGAAAVLAWMARGGAPPLWIDPGGVGHAVGEALPPDVPPLLARLGASAALDGARQSRGVVSSWEAPQPAYSDFMLGAARGWVVDRARFDGALRAIAERAGAALRVDALDGIARAGEGFEWRLRSGATGRAARVVDASGRAAVAARRLGATRRRVDRLAAVVGRLPLRGVITRVHIEAARDGWWYLGPVPGGEAVVAWMSDADLIKADGVTGWDRWRDALLGADRIASLVDDTSEAELRVVSAGSGALDRAAGAGWVAVGDAAWTVDPLASAGIGKALGTAIAGVDALAGDGEAYAAAQVGAFERYLDQRRAYYARVRRFDGRFWRRRARPLRIGPGAVLVAGEAGSGRDVPLSPREWAALWRGWDGRAPRTAAALVRAMGDGDAARRRVEAVEALCAQGVLRVAAG